MTHPLPQVVLTSSPIQLSSNLALPHGRASDTITRSALPESLIFQNRFSIDGDLDDVADDDAAPVHGVVPIDTKVQAID